MSEEIPKFSFAIREDLEDVSKLFLPTKAEQGCTGWDVACAQPDRKPIVLRAGQYVKIPLGFRVLPEYGWWLQLVPRSSSFAKKYLHALYGTIDFSYRGEVLAAFNYLPDINSLANDLVLNFGDKIAQIIPYKLQHMDVRKISNEDYDTAAAKSLYFSQRGVGGFGSSDLKKE